VSRGVEIEKLIARMRLDPRERSPKWQARIKASG
jgi:hypothetical protein